MLQTVDVGLGFVDFPSQCGRFPLRIFQPSQPADSFIAHIAQSPDQLIGLGGIPFKHRGIVSIPWCARCVESDCPSGTPSAL